MEATFDLVDSAISTHNAAHEAKDELVDTVGSWIGSASNALFGSDDKSASLSQVTTINNS